MANYMDSWMDRKIFKVSQPPGMASSINLAWDQPQNQGNKNQRRNKNQHYLLNKNRTQTNQDRFVTENRSYGGNVHGQYQRSKNNLSINDYKAGGSKHISNFNNISPNGGNINMINNNQINNLEHRYNINKPYMKYLNPSFIEPRGTKILSQVQLNNNLSTLQNAYSIGSQGNLNIASKQPYYQKGPSNQFNWKQSSKILQQELKFYQQKNRLLMQKMYNKSPQKQMNGYDILDVKLKRYQNQNEINANRFFVNKYNNNRNMQNMDSEYQSPKLKSMTLDTNRGYDRRGQSLPYSYSAFEGKDQLQRALYNQQSSKIKRKYDQNINESYLSNNNGDIMYNNSQIRTSVKVHGPPGGYSSIKFG